jgi:Coenzyme PQQ synthesis protein D (PqqD)
MRVERTSSSDLRVEELPDGSKVIVDPKSETVFGLNATAGAAWDACSQPTTVSEVAKVMQRSIDTRITEELALEAILQLQEKKLVKTSDSSPDLTRRAMLPILGGISVALPLVVSLTMLEQRAHAQFIHSVP